MPTSPIVIGALLLLLTEASFAAIGAMIKYLSDDLSQSQLVFFRNFFALLPLLPWLFRQGITGLKTDIPHLHLARSISGVVGMYGLFYVLSNIPLAQAMMIILVAPFIVPVISHWWLKESISRITVMSLIVGFIGAAVTLKPTKSIDWSDYRWYVLIACISTVLVAFNKVAIRRMSQSEPPIRIVFYFTLCCCVTSLIPTLLDWRHISLENWGWLLLMGMLASTGQLAMTKAFQLASPSRIGLLTYSSVFFAAAFGYFIWNEPITTQLLIGSLLIFYAAWVGTRQRWWK